MADAEPRNLDAQMGVAQGFLSANEPREATGFADKAAGLAEETGDRGALGKALTVGAMAYQKAGDYPMAAQRARRALEIDPGNRAAMAVYQMSKGRTSGGSGGATAAASGAGGGPAAAAPPLPAATGQASGSGRGAFAATGADAATGAPGVEFVSPATQRALKLTAEAGRKWKFEREEALRLLDAAVAADARSAAARAARARARLETGDFPGALEDADAALSAGPSAAMHALKGEALLALGRKGEEMLSHFKTAAEMDSDFSARYQELLAGGGAAPGASAPDAAHGMNGEAAPRTTPLLPLLGAGLLLLALIAWLLSARRRATETSE